MAPNLATSQHAMIQDMLIDEELTHAEMASAARCSERAIDRIISNMKSFGVTKAPPNGVGRPRRMTPVMLDALREHLIGKPELYLDEMVVFLFDDFGVLVDASTVSRALKSISWSKKMMRQIAEERNADLRDFYLHTISAFPSYQLLEYRYPRDNPNRLEYTRNRIYPRETDAPGTIQIG
jgi:transposase